MVVIGFTLGCASPEPVRTEAPSDARAADVAEVEESLTLLDPGVEPRFPLPTARFADGRSYTLTSRGFGPQHRGPEFDLVVRAREAGGAWSLTVRELRRLTPDEEGHWSSDLPLAGLEVPLTVHPASGRISVAVPPPVEDPVVRDDLVFAVEGVGFAVPTEPVGVGARWEVVSTRSAGGATALERTVYTVEFVSEADAGVGLTWTLEAPPGSEKVFGKGDGSLFLGPRGLEGTTRAGHVAMPDRGQARRGEYVSLSPGMSFPILPD